MAETDDSYAPSISADGQRIAFQSDASDLMAGGTDDNGYWFDVYLRDFSGGSPTTVLVSHAASSATTPVNDMSQSPQISRDGSTVVFLSVASNLASGVTDGNGHGEDLFAFDVASGVVVAVNIVSGGAATGDAGRTLSSISQPTARSLPSPVQLPISPLPTRTTMATCSCGIYRSPQWN